jgi:hypothetical protein
MIISNQQNKIDMTRPSVTQGSNGNGVGSISGSRGSPRGINIKG